MRQRGGLDLDKNKKINPSKRLKDQKEQQLKDLGMSLVHARKKELEDLKSEDSWDEFDFTSKVYHGGPSDFLHNWANGVADEKIWNKLMKQDVILEHRVADDIAWGKRESNSRQS